MMDKDNRIAFLFPKRVFLIFCAVLAAHGFVLGRLLFGMKER